MGIIDSMEKLLRYVALVVNPSRENEKSLRLANSIIRILQMGEIRFELFIEEWPSMLAPFTEAWVVGGDGTINWFINKYPGIEIPIALFGGGSGNDFHWMLYGTPTLEDQVEKVLVSTPKRVDAGICNGSLFLNGVGIGFDGAIVKDLLGKKKLAGKASYLLSILKHIVSYQEKDCIIQAGEVRIQQPCFMISIANGQRYGGGFTVAPRASISDGLLDLNIAGRIPALKRIKYLPVIEKGEHLDLPFITYLQSGKVLITSLEKLHTHIDGEYVYENSFEIECLPGRFSFLY